MMLLPGMYFPLDKSKPYQFWEIGVAIRETYPIGINPLNSPVYYEFPGIKKLEQTIADNILDAEKFKEIWVSFNKQIKLACKKDINSTTYGYAPSFSSDIILEKYEDNALMRVKKMSFAVSLISPFYIIYGVDETFIKINGQPEASGYHAINVITVSPFDEFERYFIIVKGLIEQQFSNYKFLPFCIAILPVKELFVPYMAYKECNVFMALFNPFIENHVNNMTRGDITYGYDELD